MLVCPNAHVTVEVFLISVTHLMQLLGVSHRFKTPIKSCRVISSFVPLGGFEFSVSMYGLDAVGRCWYYVCLIAPRLSMMFTGIGHMPQGTCWSALICF